jgi:hypothetical protein
MPVNNKPLVADHGFQSPNFSVDENGNLTCNSLTIVQIVDPVDSGGVDGAGAGIPTFDNIIVGGVELLHGGDSSISLGDGITGSFLTRLGTLDYLNVSGDVVISEGSVPFFTIVDGSIAMTNVNRGNFRQYRNLMATSVYRAPPAVGVGSGAVFDVDTVNGQYQAILKKTGAGYLEGDILTFSGEQFAGRDMVNDMTIEVVTLLPGGGIETFFVFGSASLSTVGSMNGIEIGIKDPADAKFLSVETNELQVGPRPDSTSGLLTVVGNLNVTGNGNISTLTVENSITADDITADDITINNQPTEIYHATRKDYVDVRAIAFSIALGA